MTVPPTPVRVPSQCTFAPSQSYQSDNGKSDNVMTIGAVFAITAGFIQ